MPLPKLLLLYLFTALVFFAIDIAWLGVISKDFYDKQIGHLRGDTKWVAAIIFYLVYIIGILIFSVLPGLKENSFQHTLLYGALFGFFCYATYDMTNLATLKGWPIKMVIIDIIWGTVLTGTVATVGWFIGKWLMG